MHRFKGVLLPLVKSGDCTLREALVFGSVLAKASVPQAHAAVVIMKLAELPYSGAQSVFLIVLLNKKYALPVRVVSAVARCVETTRCCLRDRVGSMAWRFMKVQAIFFLRIT